jgi:hypothetical protein
VCVCYNPYNCHITPISPIYPLLSTITPIHLSAYSLLLQSMAGMGKFVEFFKQQVSQCMCVSY